MGIGQMVTCGLAQWKATVSKQKKKIGTKNVTYYRKKNVQIQVEFLILTMPISKLVRK
jgi:hypothetical protein